MVWQKGWVLRALVELWLCVVDFGVRGALSAAAEGEVKAVVFGPFAHGVVADAKAPAKGTPVADFLHEVAEFLGAGAGNFAVGQLLARPAAEEVAAV